MPEFIPYVFSIFSNPPAQVAGHLEFIDKEEEALEKLFQDIEIKHGAVVRYIPETDKLNNPLTIRDISDRMEQWKNRNTIIHYSGHADEVSLTIQETDLRAVNFIKSIEQCENLKVVVLNACSTQGFVRQILEHTNVKAVIATTNPVRDDRAMMFAKWFYQKFAAERNTLAEAFTYAVSRALENSGAYENDSYMFKTIMNKDYKISRGELLFDRKQAGVSIRGTKKNFPAILENANQPATWGLYTKADDILDWKLFESAIPTEVQREKLEVEKKSLGKAKLEAIAKQSEQQERLMQFKERLAKAPGDQLFIDTIAGLEEGLKVLKLEIDQKVRFINDVDLAIAQLSVESRDETIISSYRANFKNLNYDMQGAYVKAIGSRADKAIFKGFILHGTADCCLDYLSVKMAKWLGLSDIEKVIYDFASVTVADFWQVLTQKIPGVNSNDPQAIVQGLYNQFVSDGITQKDMVFLFRNITGKDGNESHAGRVFSFWKQLIELWNVHKLPVKVRHHIYALIIDDRCELIAGPEFTSNREAIYKTLINNDPLFQNAMCLVPVVRPLQETIITQWEKECELKADLRYYDDELTPLLQQTGGFFRPTLRTISKDKIKVPGKRELLLSYIKEAIENAQL